MTRHLLALLLLLIAGRAWADDPPSVLVQTKPAERGSLPDLVEAYGTAAPALNGGMTISLQQEGLVAAIAVTPGETVRQGQSLLQFGESAAASSTYQQAVSALTFARTEVRCSAVPGSSVLHGALQRALATTREAVFSTH